MTTNKALVAKSHLLHGVFMEVFWDRDMKNGTFFSKIEKNGYSSMEKKRL